jgi:membrane associated rhomboid family serine protease
MLGASYTPLVYALIVANVLISFYALYVDQRFLRQSVFNMEAVLKKRQYHRIITSGFLHGSPLHLLFNMLSLYFLGPAVEARLGTANFAVLYFGSQLTAMGLTMLVKRDEMDYSSLGASGAVSGVVLAFCTFAPFSMLYLFGIVPIPAIGVAVFYLAYSTFVMNRESKIAHEAHLGGGLGGVLITLFLMRFPLF